jgi:DNA (cytosine-5)-methyltransferase 1
MNEIYIKEMEKEIDIIELFSGIGGFSRGFQEAGYTIKKHSFSEIDKHAIANYKYNFKNAESIGSVKDVHGLPSPDIITFGSPCQDFSLAGKRMGMGGERSSLITEAIRLISELRPPVFIWENVKGTFSSNNGEDFWAIIAAFANIGGYRLEWQLLNTSWFLPQNRERIYLIGHLDGRSIPGVFPFRESDFLCNERYEKGSSENASSLNAGDFKSWVGNFLVKSATKSGFEIAKVGDSINLSNPKSETRRGRVGKGVANTLDTACNQAVVAVANPDRKIKNQNGSRFKQNDMFCLTAEPHGVMQINKSIESVGKQPYQQNRVYDSKGISPAIDIGSGRWAIKKDVEIRRLTEIECERLQGFPDDWTKFGNYDGQIKEIAKTQRYKMCGNAVTVAVVKAIAERIKIIEQ